MHWLARGGVYLAGGIAAKLLPHIDAAAVHQSLPGQTRTRRTGQENARPATDRRRPRPAGHPGTSRTARLTPEPLSSAPCASPWPPCTHACVERSHWSPFRHCPNKPSPCIAPRQTNTPPRWPPPFSQCHDGNRAQPVSAARPRHERVSFRKVALSIVVVGR